MSLRSNIYGCSRSIHHTDSEIVAVRRQGRSTRAALHAPLNFNIKYHNIEFNRISCSKMKRDKVHCEICLSEGSGVYYL